VYVYFLNIDMFLFHAVTILLYHNCVHELSLDETWPLYWIKGENPLNRKKTSACVNVI